MHLKVMQDALVARFGDRIEVFPRLPDLAESYVSNDIGVHLPLIEAIVEMQYDRVIDVYNNVDIFVIDLALIAENDKLGIQFCKYLNKTAATRKAKKIIVSHYPMTDLFDELKDLGADYIGKDEYDAFEHEVVDRVNKIIKKV